MSPKVMAGVTMPETMMLAGMVGGNLGPRRACRRLLDHGVDTVNAQADIKLAVDVGIIQA